MKKYTYLFMFLLLFASVNAQNSAGTMDDQSRIAITPVLNENAEAIPASARQTLLTKLQSIASQNGLAASGNGSRFLLATTANVITKDVTATAPPMVAMNIELTLLVVDYTSQTIFSSATIPLKGVGRNENKAVIQALRNLNGNNAEVKRCLEEGKMKIVEFFNTQCDFIIRQAEAEADMRQFDKALYTLTSIPSVSKDCYFEAMDKSAGIFQRYIDFVCEQDFATAQSIWIANPNMDGANAMIPYLSKIYPDASCYEDAQTLVGEVAQKVRANEQGDREWRFEMIKWADGVSLESQRIQAYRDVGVAYGNNQPQIVYQLGFLGW